MANGRIYWSEASAGVKGRLFWSEVEGAPPDLAGRIFWSEVAPADAGLAGRIFWSAVEAEAPSGLIGRIFWSSVIADAPPTIYTLTAEAGAYVMTWTGSTSQVVLEAEPGEYVMDGQDATLTGPAPVDPTAEAIWAYLLPNGLSAGEAFAALHAYLSELHKIHGLLPSAPLAVTGATRTAGDISQTISDSAGVVTVTRQ